MSVAEREEWERGFDLGAWGDDRDRLLRYVAPLKSSAWLAGFLTGYDVAARQACACGECPRHRPRVARA